MSKASPSQLLPSKRRGSFSVEEDLTEDRKSSEGDTDIKILSVEDSTENSAAKTAKLEDDYKALEAELKDQKNSTEKGSDEVGEHDEEADLDFEDAKEEEEQRERMKRVEMLRRKFKTRLEGRRVKTLALDYASSSDAEEEEEKAEISREEHK